MLHRFARLGSWVVLLIALCLACDSVARAAEGNNKEATEKTTAALGPEALKTFDRLIKQEIGAGKIVGCAAMLMQDGKIVYEKQWGLRDREEELAVKKDSIWRIYSMSKPITSVAVMQLVDQGKIKLDDPVSKFLPKYAKLEVLQDGKKVAMVREMTVRDLLRHTSGLTYGFFGNTPVDKEYRKSGVLTFDRSIQQTTVKLSKLPLLHQPGTRWHYSVSTDVLGRIIEVASEQSFDAYLEEHLFRPLGMKDTFFTVPEEKQKRFAQMYTSVGRGADRKLQPASPRESRRFVNATNFHSGGGGLCSTSADYLKFCQMLLGEGTFEGKQILKPESVREMFKDQLPEGAAGKDFQFGLGFRISKQKDYSWGGAAGTRFWIDPKNKLAGVYMIQIYPFRSKDYGTTFKRHVYQAIEKAK